MALISISLIISDAEHWTLHLAKMFRTQRSWGTTQRCQPLQVLRSCSLKEPWTDSLGRQWPWVGALPHQVLLSLVFLHSASFYFLDEELRHGRAFNISKVTQLVKAGARMQIQVCGIQLLLIINFAKIKHVWRNRPARGAGKWQVSLYFDLVIPFLKACRILARVVGAGTSEDAPDSLM